MSVKPTAGDEAVGSELVDRDVGEDTGEECADHTTDEVDADDVERVVVPEA